MNKNEFDNIIETIMLEFNITTNKELADFFNTSPQYISQIRNKKNIEVLKKLAIKNDNDKVKQIIFKNIEGDNVEDLHDNAIGIQYNKSISPKKTSKNFSAEVDQATYSLFLEAYSKVKDNEEDLKKFRLYLMDY